MSTATEYGSGDGAVGYAWKTMKSGILGTAYGAYAVADILTTVGLVRTLAWVYKGRAT